MKLAGSGRTQPEFGRYWNPAFAERRRSDMFKFPWARFPLNARLRPVREETHKTRWRTRRSKWTRSGCYPVIFTGRNLGRQFHPNTVFTLYVLLSILHPKIRKILVNRFPFGSKKSFREYTLIFSSEN